jgi:hypothetical protein
MNSGIIVKKEVVNNDDSKLFLSPNTFIYIRIFSIIFKENRISQFLPISCITILRTL